VGHQLVDVAFEFSESEAGPDLGCPGVAEEIVEGAEAVSLKSIRCNSWGRVERVRIPRFSRNGRRLSSRSKR
jgi:hypothetical protein